MSMECGRKLEYMKKNPQRVYSKQEDQVLTQTRNQGGFLLKLSLVSHNKGEPEEIQFGLKNKGKKIWIKNTSETQLVILVWLRDLQPLTVKELFGPVCICGDSVRQWNCQEP